jgi:hypothetical protein
MSADTDQLGIEADPGEGISVERWDEIIRELPNGDRVIVRHVVSDPSDKVAVVIAVPA